MMCKMIKKGVVGAALGAGALTLLFGTKGLHYARYAVQTVRANAQGAVPIDADIDSARRQVEALGPAIDQNKETLAKAEIDVEYLEREITETAKNLDGEKVVMSALRNHLSTGDIKLTGGASYTTDEVKGDLARRFDHYKQVQRIVTEKQETLKLRKRAVVAGREQLDTMLAAKQALATKIEGIETRLKQIEAAAAQNEFSFDDSALARAKKSVSDLDKRLAVMARKAEYEGRYADKGMPVTVTPGRDVLKEVDAELGTCDKAPATTTADKNL